MEATIGQGTETQIFGTDSLSSLYFEQDGFSLCKDAYNLEFKFCEGDSLQDCYDNNNYVDELDWFEFDEETFEMKIGSDLGTERRRSLTVASIGPQHAFVTITIVYPDDVYKDEITLPISLVCASDDDACNGLSSLDGTVKKPESLDYTKPVCSRQVDGEIIGTREDDMWFAQYQYYRMTSITMYKSDSRISGFSVKYEVPDDEEEFTGWDA